MDGRFNSFSEIIVALGSTKNASAILGTTTSHVRVMKVRNSIPLPYWPALVEATQLGITYEQLVRMAVSAGDGRVAALTPADAGFADREAARDHQRARRSQLRRQVADSPDVIEHGAKVNGGAAGLTGGHRIPLYRRVIDRFLRAAGRFHRGDAA